MTTATKKKSAPAQKGGIKLNCHFSDPFDVLRAKRALAPHDSELNDRRWLIGESLRRLHQRARVDALRALLGDEIGTTDFRSRANMPGTEISRFALAKWRSAEQKAGPAAWPIVTRIVIEGAALQDCRAFVPEVAMPSRADAVITDRLRVALDEIGELVGVGI